MSETKLKPCPFCGGEATIYKSKIGFGVMCKYTPFCCTMVGYKTKEEAINAWNNRKPVDDVLERLKQLKHEENLLTAECVPHIFAVSALREAIKIVKEVAADDK